MYPVLSPQTIGQQECSAAYAGAKVTGSYRIQREKDEIRRQRLIRYLTQTGRVAKPLSELATLGTYFVNPEGLGWQP